jgi:hypothetical protein
MPLSTHQIKARRLAQLHPKVHPLTDLLQREEFLFGDPQLLLSLQHLVEVDAYPGIQRAPQGADGGLRAIAAEIGQPGADRTQSGIVERLPEVDRQCMSVRPTDAARSDRTCDHLDVGVRQLARGDGRSPCGILTCDHRLQRGIAAFRHPQRVDQGQRGRAGDASTRQHHGQHAHKPWRRASGTNLLDDARTMFLSDDDMVRLAAGYIHCNRKLVVIGAASALRA